MTELKDKAREKVAKIFYFDWGTTKWEYLTQKEKKPWLNTADKVFAATEIAVVDRAAKLPANPYDLHCIFLSEVARAAAYDKAQIDIIEDGWIKEVK